MHVYDLVVANVAKRCIIPVPDLPLPIEGGVRPDNRGLSEVHVLFGGDELKGSEVLGSDSEEKLSHVAHPVLRVLDDGNGQLVDAPLEQRMADLENVALSGKPEVLVALLSRVEIAVVLQGDHIGDIGLVQCVGEVYRVTILAFDDHFVDGVVFGDVGDGLVVNESGGQVQDDVPGRSEFGGFVLFHEHGVLGEHEGEGHCVRELNHVGLQRDVEQLDDFVGRFVHLCLRAIGNLEVLPGRRQVLIGQNPEPEGPVIGFAVEGLLHADDFDGEGEGGGYVLREVEDAQRVGGADCAAQDLVVVEHAGEFLPGVGVREFGRVVIREGDVDDAPRGYHQVPRREVEQEERGQRQRVVVLLDDDLRKGQLGH